MKTISQKRQADFLGILAVPQSLEDDLVSRSSHFLQRYPWEQHHDWGRQISGQAMRGLEGETGL